jgi:hypothetical protein
VVAHTPAPITPMRTLVMVSPHFHGHLLSDLLRPVAQYLPRLVASSVTGSSETRCAGRSRQRRILDRGGTGREA